MASLLHQLEFSLFNMELEVEHEFLDHKYEKARKKLLKLDFFFFTLELEIKECVNMYPITVLEEAAHFKVK